MLRRLHPCQLKILLTGFSAFDTRQCPGPVAVCNRTRTFVPQLNLTRQLGYSITLLLSIFLKTVQTNSGTAYGFPALAQRGIDNSFVIFHTGKRSIYAVMDRRNKPFNQTHLGDSPC